MVSGSMAELCSCSGVENNGTVTVTDRPCASVLVTAFCLKAILAMESVNAATPSITPANFVIVASLTKGSVGTVLRMIGYSRLEAIAPRTAYVKESQMLLENLNALTVYEVIWI